jgi:hypothetical protein
LFRLFAEAMARAARHRQDRGHAARSGVGVRDEAARRARCPDGILRGCRSPA